MAKDWRLMIYGAILILMAWGIYLVRYEPNSQAGIICFIVLAFLILLASFVRIADRYGTGLTDSHYRYLLWRITTFLSGALMPLSIVVGDQLYPKNPFVLGLYFSFMGLASISSGILSRKLGRNPFLWPLLTILFAGIPNMVLSIQTEESREGD